MAWPPEARRSTKFLWDWRAPTISYVAGLKELTSFTLETSGPAPISIGALNEPNMHVLRLELAEHPGFILKPNHVVAISGHLRVRTKWSFFFNLHAWVCGSFRKILFEGTGSLYICGFGGFTIIDATVRRQNVEEDLVIGYDSRSLFRTTRTETFWPYFRDRTSLYDYAFEGPSLTLCEAKKPPGHASANPVKRTLDTILNVVGKLLGF
jgi:uncharacterized protein (AIM24 family)